MKPTDAYPPIGDYGLVTDCHSLGLVSRCGSLDWLCMPRSDSPSVFGRMLDWERGGYCSITPADPEFEIERRYLPGTLVLETTFTTDRGRASVLDAITMRSGGRTSPYRQVVRVVDCHEGEIEMNWDVVPRLEYGSVSPWIRPHGPGVFSAIGGSTGIVVVEDAGLRLHGDGELRGDAVLHSGDRRRLSMTWLPPERLDRGPDTVATLGAIDRRLDETISWWLGWSGRIDLDGFPDTRGVLASAMVLKGLTNPLTGAIAAAGTTSLPEVVGGERNWDYRASWVRDSAFTVRELADLGYPDVANGFRRFVERSAAGNAGDLQVMYGLGGEVRLDEVEIPMEGYRGSHPVRIGNDAFRQRQLDTPGYLVILSRRWAERGEHPDDDYWPYLHRLVDGVCERWTEPDRGIWEVRGEPEHFVHSKAMCWAALDGAFHIADVADREVEDAEHWGSTREEIRREIEQRGYDEDRGIFVRTFDGSDLDAALLLLPSVGFVDYDDPRMVRTADAIRDELSTEDGLLRRYTSDDGLSGDEGVFLAASFWLVECLARQGRRDEARSLFDRVVATRNDLGLFGEEYDPEAGEILGNYPQGLTHLAHIGAAMALAER